MNGVLGMRKPNGWSSATVLRYIAYKEAVRTKRKWVGRWHDVRRAEPRQCNHHETVCDDCLPTWMALGTFSVSDHGYALYCAGCSCAVCTEANRAYQDGRRKK